MALESALHVDELVVSNPVGAVDPLSTADDHLRMIKDVLKRDFPDVDQATSSIFMTDTEPPLKRKGTLWVDTAADLLKLRNEANDGWITLAVSILASNSIDINAGTIDGVAINASTIGAGTPSTIVATTIQGTTVGASGLLTGSAGFALTGNMTVTGTVDTRDIGADGTKLDTIESGAHVNIALASQAEAEAGIEATKTMTSQRVKQAIDEYAARPRTFTSDDTYTVELGITKLLCEVVGAGGSGGQRITESTVSGGGGGAFAKGTINVVAGNTITVTVGLGGPAQTGLNLNGTAGEDSVVSDGTDDITAGGGSSGKTSPGSSPGGTVSHTNATILIDEDGGAGEEALDGRGGAPASITNNQFNSSGEGTAGRALGYGGNGASSPGGGDSGAGRDGYVIITPLE